MPAAEKPRLPAGQVETLQQLHTLAAALGLEQSLMLIGATARLLQLDWPLNLTARTTADLDFVVQVSSWDQHRALMQSAVAAGFASAGHDHRLRHERTDTLVDLVPFGGLENPEGTIRWSRSEHEMSVWGMLEAEHTADTMEIAPGVSVRVVTLPCLVALKLFAWRDRGLNDKGAGDLRDADFILTHCCQLPAFENLLWEAYAAATEMSVFADQAAAFDFADHAGAAVIGQQLAPLLRPETVDHLLPILTPLATDPYHPAIQQLTPARANDQVARQSAALRYAILSELLQSAKG